MRPAVVGKHSSGPKQESVLAKSIRLFRSVEQYSTTMQKYLFVAVVLVCVASKKLPSLKEEEADGDVPPPPKHHGLHVMQKLSKTNVDKRMNDWHPNDKQNIWELSGLHEGDIMEEGESRQLARNAILDESKRWAGAVVPYYISKQFDEHEKDIIRGAMDEYHEKSCVRFRPYKKGDDDYVYIRGDSPGCWSYVGRRGGGQVVNLMGRCVQHGVAIHELLHALGFHHQQSATNRDDYIKIHWENIWPRTRRNFKKYSSFRITDYNVPYDYQSIMHYSTHAFSRNGKPTITPLEDGATIGQRFGLSDKDTKKLNLMYPCNKVKSEFFFDNDYDVARHESKDVFWTPRFLSFWDSRFHFF